MSQPDHLVQAPTRLHIDLPPWIPDVVDWEQVFADTEQRMRLAVELSRQNTRRGTGGPFGAAVFESDTGRLVSVGVNSVVRLNNCALHAELMALMLAQRRCDSYTLAAPGMPRHELVVSCDPCAMCLGAVLWSGVQRLVCGAARDDAMLIQFEEGPVFDASYAYLAARGIAIERGLLRDEAREVLLEYGRSSGPIYNA